MSRLFGTDGVRGVAGKWPLTAEFVRRLGHFAGVALRKAGRRDVLVVRDTRRSGPALQKALAAGLAGAGCRALDGGVLPTPAAAVLIPRRSLAGGAVISASHNPAAFNGVKFFGPRGEKLSEGLERRIEAGALSGGALSAPSGSARPFPRARREYLDFLRSAWPRGLDLKGVRLALDCAHGAASSAAPEFFRSLGAEVLTFFHRPDGSNINRGCGALHPSALAFRVRGRGIHLGAALDGDGDRAIFVDETGRVRDGDAVLLAAARHWKARGRLRGNRVVVTVMANLGLFRALEALDIRTTTAAVGDKYVWQAMRETGAVLGGEPSGHVIFRDFLGTGDGLLTTLQVLAVMRETGRPLSALTSLAVRYPQVLLNVPVREKRPLESLNGFSRQVKAVEKSLGGTGRVLVRYSGTEPLLRIMIEGSDQGLIGRHARALAEHVKKTGI